jgi:hypothetical protein
VPNKTAMAAISNRKRKDFMCDSWSSSGMSRLLPT